MPHLNVEIKARCTDPNRIRAQLLALGADFIGEDHQVDTYFRAAHGRLKLREGNIENALIHYARPDQAGPKDSAVALYNCRPDDGLKEVLRRGLEVIAVVDKKRAIFFIDNVKFHIDRLAEMGTFLEIEAIDRTGKLGREKLLAQCRHYLQVLGIRSEELLEHSYSDMVINARSNA